MARIFISYSRTDEAFARQLATDLARLGADIWIDVEDIPAGMDWSNAIQEGLDTCEVMLLILSVASSTSPNVEEEWKYFKDQGKPIIPILLEPCKVHYRLRRLQYIDFKKQNYDRAMRQLHAALNRASVELESISALDTIIPAQEPLPVKDETKTAQASDLEVMDPAQVASPVNDDSKTEVVQDRSSLVQEPVARSQATAEVEIPARLSNRADTRRRAFWVMGVVIVLILMGAVLFSNLGEKDDDQRTSDATESETETYIPAMANEAWTPIEQEFNGVPFVYVPEGCFMMGSDEEHQWDEITKPAHRVCLSEFWIGQTEVTNSQYAQCVSAGICTEPSNLKYYVDPEYADHPVVYIDWEQAKTYAEWIGGSLPTEAQWEYAARGPEGWLNPWGEGEVTCELANISYCTGDTTVVGSYLRGGSWVGALDMVGNVAEWTGDWFDYTHDGTYKSYYASLIDGVLDPSGPVSGSERVTRGSTWESSWKYLWPGQLVSGRWGRYTGDPRYFLGFRVARAP